MISEIREYKMHERSDSKKYMPPLLTAGILAFIICFVFFARGLASPVSKLASIPVMSMGLITVDETEKSDEQLLEAQLSGVLKVFDIRESNADNESVSDLMLNELHNSAVDISEDNLLQLQDRMSELQEVIRLEGGNEFKNMSLEGRRLIIYIAKEIFVLYGYRLNVNLDGDIEKISDLSGGIVYSHSQLNFSEIQFKGLAIVISFVFIALLLCILIAKKNQLFKKDVRYDGLNKKRYA